MYRQSLVYYLTFLIGFCRLLVSLFNIYALNYNLVHFRKRAQNLSSLTLVFSCDYFYFVIFFNFHIRFCLFTKRSRVQATLSSGIQARLSHEVLAQRLAQLSALSFLCLLSLQSFRQMICMNHLSF